MLDVGLPLWRVAPSRRVFSPSCLASLTRADPHPIQVAFARPIAVGFASVLPRAWSLPTFSIAVFRPHLSACRRSWSSPSLALGSCLRTAAALLTLTALRLPASLACGMSLCASSALGRLSARVAALSFSLLSCLRRPTLCSVVWPRILCLSHLTARLPHAMASNYRMQRSARTESSFSTLDAVARAR